MIVFKIYIYMYDIMYIEVFYGFVKINTWKMCIGFYDKIASLRYLSSEFIEQIEALSDNHCIEIIYYTKSKEYNVSETYISIFFYYTPTI